MYVTRLEVPWSATEFPLQGVLLTSRQDILKISRYGQSVHIDQNKSLSSGPKQPVESMVASIYANRQDKSKRRPPRNWRKYCTQKYQANTPIAKEIVQARKLLNRVDEAFIELKTDMKLLAPVKVNELKSVSNSIVESILDNPDALLWLIKVKEHKGIVYDHTVRTVVWAITMGRSMGIQQSSLKAMAQAILLSGIGKAYLKKKDWQGYKGAKMTLSYARWSSITLHKLSQCSIDQRVVTIIANMTERYDGTGFPQQKASKEIPYLSQIASLAESFDLILYPMPGGKKRLFSQALARLYCLSDSIFDRELVEELIQAVGLYPAGTQVLLSNGYRGVVVEQSKERRLRATVALTHDQDDYRLLSYRVVELGEGKYQNVLVKREAPVHHINEDDQKRINLLIKKYQQNAFNRMMTGISHVFKP